MQAMRPSIFLGLAPGTFQCDKKLPLVYECEKCIFASDLKAILALHVSIKHEKRSDNPILQRPFKSQKCAICDFETFSMLVLTGHAHKFKHVVDDGGWFTCSHCEFVTKNKNTLKTHIRKKHPKRIDEWFKCEHCACKTANKNILRRHVLLQHVGVEKWYKFKCAECPYKCNLMKDLKAHCSKNHKKLEISLIISKRRNQNLEKNELARKTFQCEGRLPKEHKCQFCGYETDLKTTMSVHVNVIHRKRFVNPSLERAFKHKCEICAFQTFSILILTRHVYNSNHLVDDSGWFRCRKCNFATENKNTFKRHILKKGCFYTALAKRPSNANSLDNLNKYVKKDLRLHMSKDHRKTQIISELLLYKSKFKLNPRNPLGVVQFACLWEAPKDYKCKDCAFESELKTKMTVHTKVVHKKQFVSFILGRVFAYTCEICEFQTNSLLVLTKHVYSANHVANGDGWFTCDQCSFKTVDKTEFKRHVSTSPNLLVSNQHKNTNLECEFCPFKAKRRCELTSHTLTKHSNEKIRKFKCTQCHYEAFKKPHLAAHVLAKHTDAENIQWFECPQCPRKSKWKRDLKDHILKIHEKEDKINYYFMYSDEETHWFECVLCSYKTNKRSSVKEHILKEHPDETDWMQCDKCAFSSKSKKILRLHAVRQHENAFKCHFCPYETKNKQHLKYHIVVKHTNADHAMSGPNERYLPHRCEHCSFRFASKATLRNHVIAKHTSAEDIRWFRCEQCPYKSHRKANLTTHIIAKHTKEEEIPWFQCEHCTYKAKDKGSLKKHVIRRHTDLLKQLSC